jgi:hypothetical protein
MPWHCLACIVDLGKLVLGSINNRTSQISSISPLTAPAAEAADCQQPLCDCCRSAILNEKGGCNRTQPNHGSASQLNVQGFNIQTIIDEIRASLACVVA